MFFWRERIEPSGARYGVEWAFTDRRGGSSQAPFDQLNLARHVGDLDEAVTTNRHRLAHELGLRLADLRFMDQVHGCDVAVTPGTQDHDQEQADAAPSVDGLISGRTDEALVVMVADCVPVLLVDRTEGFVAAVHAGRLGMVTGVVPATVAGMRELGAEDIEALVGPSVCARCYEVPAEMRDAAAAVAPSAAAVTWTGTPAIDVAAGVVEQLVREGVPVRWLPGCTRENPDLYSHRRDGQTGRFVGVVRLLEREQVA
ncbi:peptidoglycan editing factor PgeF [Ornithinimicrobium pekingense]|uniref:Purine nucleoside phosphorylase n=1 Tax=Ornithinimicrobium pekingense TaxID=384677 RepID=A0ABQ2F770_9MICO|nr:peptidoglycan editing factor PgeF [Ornithinimicrobium pekingense]GGK68710.1 laccase domain protein [Ornithinimicrobium pekingense]